MSCDVGEVKERLENELMLTTAPFITRIFKSVDRRFQGASIACLSRV